MTTAGRSFGVDSSPASARATPAAGGLRWVHDPADDQACLHHLAALHELATGRVVCHPAPGATGPILTRDLLEALGKHRDARARARRVGDGADLVRTWMRAERVRHLVVLRAHRLRPPLLAALAELATAAAVTVWLVWHDTDLVGDVGRGVGVARAQGVEQLRQARVGRGDVGGVDLVKVGGVARGGAGT